MVLSAIMKGNCNARDVDWGQLGSVYWGAYRIILDNEQGSCSSSKEPDAFTSELDNTRARPAGGVEPVLITLVWLQVMSLRRRRRHCCEWCVILIVGRGDDRLVIVSAST